MSRTRQSLKFVSALCLALLVYAAIPHFHGPHGAGAPLPIESPAGAEATTLGAPAAPAPAAVLLADLAHESHSSSPERDTHPCTLCRDGASRALPAPAEAKLRPAPDDARSRPLAPAEPFRELRLAERHAARAPPRA